MRIMPKPSCFSWLALYPEVNAIQAAFRPHWMMRLPTTKVWIPQIRSTQPFAGL